MRSDSAVGGHALSADLHLCGLLAIASRGLRAAFRARAAFNAHGRNPMNRRSILSLAAMTALGIAFLPGSAVSQQKSLKEQLVGTWTFVSAVDVQKDGTKVDRWGANPKGILMFDGNGRYSLIIMRSDLPKFTAKSFDQGTAEENKAVMQGLIVHFGTYSVDEDNKTITTRVEGSSFPNLTGQKRIITSLTADELKYTNPTSATGTTAEAAWKRAK
jgi:Lipocalin-like domain